MRVINQLSRWKTINSTSTSSIIAKRSIQSTTRQPQQDQQQKEVPKLYGVTYVPTLKITRQHTKRGDYGLYDGLRVRAGDQVSKSKHRTKRTWKPNVQKTTLWSEVLSQSLQLRVSTGALKMIDRLGGLDRYVLQMMISAMQERVRLTKAFTRPIPESELWRIPRWQDSKDRVHNQTARIMVPSVEVAKVSVFPRISSPDKNGNLDPNIVKDFAVRGKRGSPTSRRSTHPRRR
ncbi:hypothetical protein H4Q26_015056 [Puccinia striiformis f. sp. tritici PST-130]|nr:hypothetical protein H4Q26_015056 [Puccinia striiformis f. sp. tritici PST-130]